MTTNRQKLLAKLGNAQGEDAIALAKDAVNNAAERARWPYVPPGHQASVYQNKAQEADALQAVLDASGTPDPADYPYLEAEVGITGADVSEVAAAVIAKRDLWLKIIDPRIEGTRQLLQQQLDDIDPAAADATEEANQIAADAFNTIQIAVTAAIAAAST